MENETSEQKEIIINDISEAPIINEESNKMEKNNTSANNKDDNNINSEPKLILKKKVNKLKKPSENNNTQNEQINIPNIEVEIGNNNISENNNMNDNNLEIKIKEEKNKGYLDDDLEDEDNKKLYLRVIKRMEKTYGVPIIASKIEGEPIDDIGLEENIRPILIGKNVKNQNEIGKNKSINNKLRNNINNNINNQNNIKINNYINNNNNKEKGQYLNNNFIYNNKNLINSQNFNYRANEYTINNPRLYNKNIYNNEYPRKYRFSMGKNNNYMNSRFSSNKARILYHPRKNSYEKMDKNLLKRLNYKYPIYKPNRIDLGNYYFNYKNLKYNNMRNYPSNYSNLRNLNQRKCIYPLKRTYYISYINRYNPEPNFSNSKTNKYKNYFNLNSINNINNKTPLVQKSTLKYFNQYKNNTKNNNIYNGFINKNNNLNLSQNILRTKNCLYNYTGSNNKYNYGIRNKNLFSSAEGSIDILNKKLNKNPFRSFDNCHLNFNYEDNINNDSYIYSPMKNNKFTYYLNSRYNCF